MKLVQQTKNFYDFLKHLASLSTGSIVVIATFAEKFQKDVSWRFLIDVSIAAFLISVLSSLICMFCTLEYHMFTEDKDDEDYNKEPVSEIQTAFIISFVFTSGFLFVGLLSLGIFFIKNF